MKNILKTNLVMMVCLCLWLKTSAQGPTMGGVSTGETPTTGNCPRLLFKYDKAGNRIKRNFYIGCGEVERTAPAPSNATAQHEEARKKVLTQSAGAIEVFPNPAQNYLMLQCPDEWLNAQWSLMAGNGGMILNGQVQSAVGEVNVSNLVNGNYFLKVELDGVAKTYKIVKID